MLITLISIYALTVSCYVLVKHRGQRRKSELDRIWKQITEKPNPTADDLKAIAEVAKVRQTEIPWYERSLSTIGIVAFFSMIVGTSFQTINSAKTQIESSSLQQEIKVLESQRSAWKKLLKNLSEVIILKQVNSSKLENSEKEVLQRRLSDLELSDSKLKEDEIEKLKIYLALKQYDKASALVGDSEELANETSGDSLLFLAEVCFMDSARSRSKTLLQKFEPSLSKQPIEWQLRFFVVSAALDTSPGMYAKDVAALKGISLIDAEDWLKDRVDRLKEQSKRRASENSDRE